jgi:hypothetical protein
MNRCDAGIPAAQYLYIEQQAEILAGDPYFGLHWGILGTGEFVCAGFDYDEQQNCG